MSYPGIGQDFGVNADPFSLVNATVTSGKLKCTSTGGSGASALYNPGHAYFLARASSRRALRITLSTLFEINTAATGGSPWVFLFTGGGGPANNQFALQHNTSRVLGLSAGPAGGLATFADLGSTLALNQQYRLDLDYREELSEGIWIRLWVDGVLDMEIREISEAFSFGPITGFSLQLGLSDFKTSFSHQYDDCYVNFGADPQ